MAKFKGTKGQWWVSGTELMCDVHTKIAKIHPTNMNDYNEHKHNAQVMAAAPEMLNMLINIFENYQNGDYPTEYEYDEIESIIKRATEL